MNVFELKRELKKKGIKRIRGLRKAELQTLFNVFSFIDYL